MKDNVFPFKSKEDLKSCSESAMKQSLENQEDFMGDLLKGTSILHRLSFPELYKEEK